MANISNFEQWLLNHQILSQEKLTELKILQQKTGKTFKQTLFSDLSLSRDSLLQTTADYLNLPYINLKRFHIQPAISKKLGEPYARHYKAVLLEQQGDSYLIGMANPEDLPSIDELKQVLKQPLKLCLIDENALPTTLDLIYRHTEEIMSFAEKLDEELSVGRIDLEALAAEQGKVDATVIKLLHSLMIDAIQANASDIHIEPDESILRLRMRIDGVLHEQEVKEKEIAAAMSLRLKLMSGLNITEKRLPQEGRFELKIREKVIDVRLAIMPTHYGESIVMRLLDPATNLLKLEQVGMPKEVLTRFYNLLKSPYGILLVTGPTGSGKTTTLYGALSYLNVPEKKIITVEDPVEYRLPRITQTQVNPKLDLTFASISKTILRHDPDIVMVGEMRDEETANIGIRAALTGHLVLTTLHTNDAPSSALRLLDMKVESYLVSSTLRGILSQRLVRRICDSCREPYPLSEAEKSWLKGQPERQYLLDAHFMHGRGCTYCNQTGYKGRIGLFELLELNKELMNDLLRKDPTAFMDHAMQHLKGKLLLDQGLLLAEQGMTSFSEVIRVAGEW